MKLQVDRGDYLVNAVVHCTMCHSQLDVKKFSLPVIPGTEGGGGIAVHQFVQTFPGKLWIPNITPFALKDWTDAEIARDITKGIRKNGDTLTGMPIHEFNKMYKEDVASVIVYIRTLKAIDTSYPKRQLLIPVSAFGPLPDNDYTTNAKPDTADKIKYGEYLVSIAGCGGCHTPEEGKPEAGKLFAGGNETKMPEFTVRTANLTPDTATGIGAWTEEMFIAKFRNNSSRENLNREPGKYNTLMPWSFFGNSTMKYLTNFKKIVLLCVKKGWLLRDPFYGFKLAKKEVIKDYLTQEELNAISQKNFCTDCLTITRDIFLFSCYTGLAYVDVHKLKRSEIAIGIDGKKWILTSRQKTEVQSRLPLLPVCLEILKRYENHPQSIIKDKVLPVWSNQKLNEYLKEIADLCGIKKTINFHVGSNASDNAKAFLIKLFCYFLMDESFIGKHQSF